MPRPLRFLAAALALGLALLVALSARQAGADRGGLVAELAPLLPSAAGRGALERLGSEPDLAAARAQLARALVVECLQPQTRDGQGAAARRTEDLRRLELAQGLAVEAFRQRPASAEAALALGAATYLDRSLRQDNRLFSEAGGWEKPLLHAIALAPNGPDPSRFLSRAYLEIWSVLPPWKREEVRQLLARGMTDRATFERLIEPWLAVAGSLDAALELVPPKPFAWERLQTLYGQRRDWPAFARAANGLRDALASDARERLAAAEAEIAAGGVAQGRADLLAVLAQLPVEGRYAPLFGQGVASLPAGPLDTTALPALAGWLDWVLAACEPGRCALPAPVLGRLLGATEELNAADRATLALLADDLAQAELIERRLEIGGEEGWRRYRRTKAAQLLVTGDAAGAEAALRPLLATAAHPAPDLLPLALAIAERRGQAQAAAELRHELATLAGDSWTAESWRLRDGESALDLDAGRAAAGLEVELRTAEPGGSVVTLDLDGSTVGSFAIAPGDSVLHLPAAVAAGRHRLLLRSLHPGTTRPGRVALSGAAG